MFNQKDFILFYSKYFSGHNKIYCYFLQCKMHFNFDNFPQQQQQQKKNYLFTNISTFVNIFTKNAHNYTEVSFNKGILSKLHIITLQIV